MPDIDAERQRADEIIHGLQEVPVVVTARDREKARKYIESFFEHGRQENQN
jgi:hypothetical protein